ncbi:MAG: type II secretion system F family protein [Gallionellaceae bacterium]|nr:type II secretion system F family protein [Gallionellaceae bacterium]
MLFDVKTLSAGRRVRLKLDAADAADASEQARLQGLTVLDVRPAGNIGRLNLGQRGHFPLSLFSKELHALLGSGLSLVESLQTLEEKESRPETRKVLAGVLKRLYDGESFSVAAGHFPDAFPPLYVATVRASERTGDLPQALSRYVAYQGQVEQVRKKVVASSVYPVLLVVLGGLVALFLLGYVTPRFAALYEDNLDRLPWASRLLMYWGRFVASHLAESVLLLLGGLTALGYVAILPGVRARLGRLAWRLPSLGERLRIFQLTRFYRTVGMLLSGGIPVVTALDMAAGLLHPELRVRLAAASVDIREGKSISQAMESADLTTPVALRMLRVGEKSGRMGEMMEAVAAFHDEETSRFVDWFTRLFEPILMAVIGLIIGLIVVLLYLPIFELAGSLE